MVNKFLCLWRKKLWWNFETNSKTCVSAFLPSALAAESLNNDIACWIWALKRPRKKNLFIWKVSCLFSGEICQNNASLMVQTVKNLPAMKEKWLWSLGRDDPLEKGMATHSRILAWRSPQKEAAVHGSRRVGHNWTTNTFYPFSWPCSPLLSPPFSGSLSPSNWSVAFLQDGQNHDNYTRKQVVREL